MLICIMVLLAGAVAIILFSADKPAERKGDPDSSVQAINENNQVGSMNTSRRDEPSNAGTVFRFFKLIFSKNNEVNIDADSDFVEVKDDSPAAFDKGAVDEIEKLSRKVGNDGGLPEDIWISPRLMNGNIAEHKEILENIIALNDKIKNGTAGKNDKRIYYELKIGLLKDRIDTLEEYNEKMQEFFAYGDFTSVEVEEYEAGEHGSEGVIRTRTMDSQTEVRNQYSDMKEKINLLIDELKKKKENL